MWTEEMNLGKGGGRQVIVQSKLYYLRDIRECDALFWSSTPFHRTIKRVCDGAKR